MRRTRAAAALLVAALALAACASTPASPKVVEVRPDASWQRIETSTGTASFRIPPGWSVDDRSAFVDVGFGQRSWQQDLAVLDEAGALRLRYLDAPTRSDPIPDLPPGTRLSIPVEAPASWAVSSGIVAEAPLAGGGPADDLVVRAWWEEARACVITCTSRFEPAAAVVQTSAEGARRALWSSTPDQLARVHVFALQVDAAAQFEPPGSFDRREDAERYLADERGATLRAILGSLELAEVPLAALPADVAPPADVAETSEFEGELERFTTSDGAVSIDLPRSHLATEQESDGARSLAVTPDHGPGTAATRILIERAPELPALEQRSGGFRIVEQRDLGGGLAVTTWVHETADGVLPSVAITEVADENPVLPVAMPSGGQLSARIDWDVASGCGLVATVDLALACLERPAAVELADALASVELR